MDKTPLKYYWYVFFFMAFIVNENFVQWALAVHVGNYGIVQGFKDAYEYFTLEGYAFFTAFRLVPYGFLGLTVWISVKKEYPTTPGIAWGGLAGIVFLIVSMSWEVQYDYYTDAHVSSTNALAFLVIPVFALVTGFAGSLAGYVFMKIKTRMH